MVWKEGRKDGRRKKEWMEGRRNIWRRGQKKEGSHPGQGRKGVGEWGRRDVIRRFVEVRPLRCSCGWWSEQSFHTWWRQWWCRGPRGTCSCCRCPHPHNASPACPRSPTDKTRPTPKHTAWLWAKKKKKDITFLLKRNNSQKYPTWLSGYTWIYEY